MSIDEVRKYISNRLVETQQWAAKEFPGQISGVYLRKYPCAVRPLDYICDSNKEGKGVRFRISWKGEAGSEAYSDLDIYIVPEGFCGKRSKYPYATIYAVDPKARTYRLQKDNCKVIQFDENTTKDLNLGETVTINEFFKNLLNISLRHERCASLLFSHQRPISKERHDP